VVQPAGSPHLGGDRFNELPHLPGQEAPPLLQMPVDGECLILGQHVYLPDTRHEAVIEGEIDDPEAAAVGHGRLGAFGGDREQTLAHATGKEHYH